MFHGILNLLHVYVLFTTYLLLCNILVVTTAVQRQLSMNIKLNPAVHAATVTASGTRGCIHIAFHSRTSQSFLIGWLTVKVDVSNISMCTTPSLRGLAITYKRKFSCLIMSHEPQGSGGSFQNHPLRTAYKLWEME